MSMERVRGWTRSLLVKSIVLSDELHMPSDLD